MKSGEQEGLSEKIETEMEKGGNEKIKVKYFKYEIGMKKIHMKISEWIFFFISVKIQTYHQYENFLRCRQFFSPMFLLILSLKLKKIAVLKESTMKKVKNKSH